MTQRSRAGASLSCHSTIIYRVSPSLDLSHRRNNKLQLSAEKENPKSRVNGVYSRPSAAIERGSGFMIPGLEGPKVGLVFGLALALLTVLNFVTASSNASDELVQDLLLPGTIGFACSLLLLGQSAIETLGEDILTKLNDRQIVDNGSSVRNSDKKSVPYSERWSQNGGASALSDQAREKLRFLAASFLSLTSANSIMFLSRTDGLLFRLGMDSLSEDGNNNSDEWIGAWMAMGSSQGYQDRTKSIFDTLDKSTSGRVSIPLTHPAIRDGPLENDSTNCVLLQAVAAGASSDSPDCPSAFLVTSAQPLASFTSDDLEWLGQLSTSMSLEIGR